MAEEMSMADDEVIEELSTLLEVWENEKDTASFDPDPLLLSVTEILEKSYNDYLMHNPDPMDKTHPMYLLPNCNFGHLLNIIFRNEEFINKLIISYVLTRDNLNRNIVAARLLLVLFSSNASEILSDEDSNSLLEELFRWAETSESRELRAYSFGLLGVAEGLPERRQHNQRLLPIALERLRTLFQEMLANNANPEDERKRVTINDPANGPTDFRTAFTLENSKDANQKKSAPASSSHPANGGGDNRIRMNGVTLGRNPWDSGDFDSTDVCKIVDSKEKDDGHRKRQRSDTWVGNKESKRPKFGNQPVCLNQINGDVQRSSAQLKPSPNNFVAPTHENGPLGLGEDFFAASGGFSNSSWKNTMHPIVIGTAYKLHPLPVEMEQRLILQYVIHACSAGDTLSLLLEHRVLDLIGLYLGKDSCKDIRLLYDVLNLTSSLLEYRKFGWDFIAAQGVQKLLQVNQYSLAGTLVANCLGILSRDVDIFSHVCQLPDSILNDLVDYALWLLDHSYESAREIIGIFFAHSLQFRAILERFDQRDGLRRLYNYIAGLAILHKTTEEIEDDPQADMLWSQSYLTIRSGVSAFRTYLSSHVFLRIEHMKRSQATRHIVGQIGMYPIPSAIPNGGHSHTKAMCLDAVSERECITYLIQTQCLLMSHHHNWRPIDDMRKLGVFRLLLVLLSKSRKPDSVRLVLEVLHLATVSPKVQLDMCETVQVKNAPTQGIGSVLEFAEGEWLDDPQIQKLALEVFINCVGAPAERGAGRGLHYKISCLSPGLLPAHLASLPSTSQGASTSSYVQNMERRVFLDPSDILYVAWTCAQQNNAIMVLTTLLHIKEPPTDADLLREVACRALNGIVRHEPVRQILSKLPLISANELNSLMQEPVLLEKRQEHSRFCEQARLLIESVTQTKIVHEYPKDMTQEKLWKASVVAQTRIVYNEKELLQLMFQHLVDIGFKKTASQLQQEANLPNIPASRIPPTPTSLPRFPRQNELSFARTKGVDTPVRPSPLVGKGAMATPTTLLRRQLSNGSASTSAATITNHLSTSSPQLPTESPKPTQMGTISTRPASSISTSLPNGISPKRLPLKFERPPSFATSSACGQFVAPQSAGTSNVLSGQFSLQVKPYKSLGEIVTEYFRKQHTACRNPVATCPPFSLFYPHRCPEPRLMYSAPTNLVKRVMSRSVPPYRCTSEMLKQADRRFVFSRFRYWKSFAEEDETFTCCNFSNDDEYIQIGNFTGDVFCYNIRTGQHISTSNCHHSYLTSIQQSKNGKLMLTSSGLMPPLSTLWRMGPQNEPQEPLIEFPEETYVDFGHNRSSHHLVGTMRSKATVYDTETGMPIVRLYDETLANGYERNRACFDPYDELVLNDGILFDPRVGSTGRVVHKFDKLNSDISGLFHPKGSEVIINSEVWDLRTYRLLHTVPALNQCKVMFNSTANIIFGVVHMPPDVSDDFEPRFNAVYNSSFRTLDAGNYQVITTMDTKKQLHDFCPDHSDNFVALIEANPIMRDPNLCKLYEVGRGREPDEEDEDEDIDEEDDDEEGDDQNDDELIDFGNTTDDDSESGTSSSSEDHLSTDEEDNDEEDEEDETNMHVDTENQTDGDEDNNEDDDEENEDDEDADDEDDDEEEEELEDEEGSSENDIYQIV